MSNKELSPREEEIVQLCAEGLTNDGIAHRLGISVATVNTYWLRIKLKVGGLARTDTVVRVIKERAEQTLRDASVARNVLDGLLNEKEHGHIETRAVLALFHFAMSQLKSTFWATDRDLIIHIIANGATSSTHAGVQWDVGKSVYDIFKTKDPTSPAIQAHVKALVGEETEVRLSGDFKNMILRVMPLADEGGAILGCISILNIGESNAVAREFR